MKPFEQIQEEVVPVKRLTRYAFGVLRKDFPKWIFTWDKKDTITMKIPCAKSCQRMYEMYLTRWSIGYENTYWAQNHNIKFRVVDSSITPEAGREDAIISISIRASRAVDEDLSEASKKEQVEFDKLMKDILTPDLRLSPKDWDHLYELIYQAEKTGLNLKSLSKMTHFNYKQWVKRNKKVTEAVEEAQYVAVQLNGSIGEKTIRSKRDLKGMPLRKNDKPSDKATATEKAKRMNKSLSPGEKKFYGIKYVVAEVKNGIFTGK